MVGPAGDFMVGPGAGCASTSTGTTVKAAHAGSSSHPVAWRRVNAAAGPKCRWGERRVAMSVILQYEQAGAGPVDRR
jgi:hypothetical protein